MTVRIIDLQTGVETSREYTQGELDAMDAIPKPSAKDIARATIDAKLSKVGLFQSWQLESSMAGILSLGLAQGLTEEQVYALNPGYRDAKDLLAEVRTLEAQL